MRALTAAALLLLPLVAVAANQVRFVQIHVEPYYQSGETREARPRVAIGNRYSQRLASTDRDDIAAVRDSIRKDSGLVTPMALMVLAIRLYDVGLRDDAVFWFYVAKDRNATIEAVLDTSSEGMRTALTATRTFAQLAGPYLNGYAYCDLARQKTLRREALEFVEKNPYLALYFEQLAARPGDREVNLARALADLRGNVAAEAAYLAEPENVAKLAAARRETEADDKYCWR